MSTATTAYDNMELGEDLLDAEHRLGMALGMDSPIDLNSEAFNPRSHPTLITGLGSGSILSAQLAHEVPPAPRSRVLPRLLAMADNYLRAGSIRQALDMYFDLARNHPDTPEASRAEDRILDVARIHEENGELHLARAIYEQMI